MQIHEASSARSWTINLNGPGEQASLPSTVHWKLTCNETGTTLQDWTAATPTTTYGDDGNPELTTITVSISPTLNEMQTDEKKIERKTITVATDKDTSTQRVFEVVYAVTRLTGLD